MSADHTRAEGETAEAALRTLIEAALPSDAGAWAIEGIEAEDGARAYRVRLRRGGDALELALSPRTESTPAFARTASLDVSHHGAIEHGSPLFQELTALIGRIARADGGGLDLARRRHSLPLAPRTAEVFPRQPEWSRAQFDEAIPRVSPEAGRAGIVVVVHQSCLMRCLFCPQPDLDLPAHESNEPSEIARHHDDLVHQLAWGRRVGATEVEFGGNDVLRYPEAVPLFGEARRLGYTTIIAQSPAQSLADPAYARAIAASGVTDLYIPLYGDEAALHDGVVGVPGAFDEVVRGIDHMLALGGPTVRIHTIALRSRLDRLEGVLSFVERRFGLAAVVSPLRPNRDDDRHHLADIVPVGELRALASRRPMHFIEQPFCGFEPEVADAVYAWTLARGGRLRPFSFYDVGRRPGMEKEEARVTRVRAFPEPCTRCARRDTCPGVLGSYVEQYGEADLIPFAT